LVAHIGGKLRVRNPVIRKVENWELQGEARILGANQKLGVLCQVKSPGGGSWESIYIDKFSTITMCLKCWGKVTNPLAFINLIDDDFGIAFEISLFTIHVKEVCDVLESFLFIL